MLNCSLSMPLSVYFVRNTICGNADPVFNSTAGIMRYSFSATRTTLPLIKQRTYRNISHEGVTLRTLFAKPRYDSVLSMVKNLLEL